MKTLKAICTAVVLVIALSIPAYGGDIETPGIKTSSSGQTQKIVTTTTTSVIGDIETPGLIMDALAILVAMF